MKPRAHKTDKSESERHEPEYRDVEWPQRGRLMFGPWCLLGAWPAVFGMVEEVEENEDERRDRQ